MSYVYEVKTRGGDPAEVRAAVMAGVERLRSGERVKTLGRDELEPWTKDIDYARVSGAATDGDAVSVLVDIEVFDRGPAADRLAAVLAGGFDELVSYAVLDVPGVREVTCGSHKAKRQGP